MKIIAIRGKNLASLAGEFEVDFTQGALAAAGIFAITGSTGSGKSTLLDALCLALFDSTPRMMKAREARVELADVSDKTVAQSDSRSVLRRGTSGGYAEVEFVALTKQVYRATWSVARAGGKPTGALRPVSMRLFNLSEAYEEQGTKKDLLAKISRLIGLSFEQFNRSVLLAQGDFALFLKAKQAEKAEILEKLTGMDIYSRVSAAIYGKTKTAELEYKMCQERMKGIELLPEEELEGLSEEKRLLLVGQATLQKELEVMGAALKWLEEEKVLRQNKNQAEKDWEKVCREKTEAAPRYAGLARLEQAQGVRDVYMRTRTALQQLAMNRQTLEDKQAAVRKAEASMQEAAVRKEVAQKELLAWKEYLADLDVQLNRAKELDVQIAEKQKQWEESKKEQAKDADRQADLTRKINLCGQTVEELEKKQSDIDGWFEHYRMYADLIPAVELVINLLTNWETAKEQKALNQKMLERVRALMETEQRRLKEMQEEAERLNHLQPAEVVLLRSQLREGEPCPVCGSIHHPAAVLTEVQSLREAELKKAKEKVSQEIERLTVSINSRGLEIAGLASVVDGYVRQATETLSKVTAHVSILPSWQELLDKGTLKEVVRRFGVQWTERQKAQGDVKEALARCRAQQEGLKQEWDASMRQAQERLAKSGVLAEELKSARSARAGLLDGCSTAEVIRRNTARLQALERASEDAMKNYHGLFSTLESMKGQMLQLEKEKARLQSLAEEGERSVDEWLSHQQGIGRREELQELLAKDAGWVVEEKRKLEQLTERFTSVQVLLAERKRKLEEHGALPQKPLPEDTEEVLQSRMAGRKAEAERHTARVAQIAITLDNQAKNRRTLAGWEKEGKEKYAVYENWSRLNELFGSQSGVKFKEIAQGYTLDVLLLYANRHLQDLAPRYELQRIPDTLALQIVDLDMMGEVRSVHSLSGGESFLVSLALALGLSSLSSNRMNVESLFIDEGFGSLDADTLRVAMDALERLQMQGRKIGVISHVAEMTERIPAQVRVVKTGNGRSKVLVANQ